MNDSNHPISRIKRNICEMPPHFKRMVLKRHFSAQDIQRMRQGIIPRNMDDRWLCYMQDNRFFMHRSWTKFCIYIIEFGEQDTHLVTVNGDSDQYRMSPAESTEIETLNRILNSVVLQHG